MNEEREEGWLLTGGTVVDGWPPQVVRADVLVVGGRIQSVTAAGSLSPARGIRILDCSGCLILPGLVIAHTHLYSALARGMPPPRFTPTRFLDVLEQVWWRLDRALTLELLRASARVGVAEALRAGATCVIDHHESPHCIDGSLDVLADVATELGVRAILCYGATERNFGEEEAWAGLQECERFILQNQRPRVRGMVGLHAGFTVSDETLSRASDTARRLGVPLHLHVAEDQCDVDAARDRGFAGALDRVNQLAPLPRHSLLAHGVHLSDEELRLVPGAEAWVVHNPRSNQNNGVGFARLSAASRRVALGTDGMGADLFAECQAGFLAGADHRDGIATRRAAERLHNGRVIASERFSLSLQGFTPGSGADCLVLDYDPPSPLDSRNFTAHLLFGLTGREVRDVMVGGEWVVRNRGLTRGDAREIQARGREASALLWQKMAEL